tara:strand:- start:294 stop:701 length:408 start_codon:yes stop_codon:yes gene_type:complete
LKNSKFDLDLAYGQDREQRVAAIFNSDKFKVEVKTERDWWYRTNNIAIEVESYGKPSGIAVTEADYWVHILANGNKDYCRLIFDTDTIRQLAKKYKHTTKRVGDGKQSKVVLIPIDELFDKSNLNLGDNNENITN